MLAALVAPMMLASTSEAAAESRSLKLYFIHTGEKAVITYKRNGRYDAKGLQQLNRFLRDWRRNQPTKMDPRLFDLVWEVYRKSGSRDYIHVVSAFRSPQTNNMLRSRSKGVAEKSQHMLGKAMDFYIPDVKLASLRAIGMKMQVGGVGFYPTSGSPFVHMDVGNVRAWPRMNRKELVRLFPDGKTMHLPSDGKPLPGYQQALAEYKRRGGAAAAVEVADVTQPKRRGLFAALFGGDEDEEPDAIAAGAATPAAPSRPAAPATRQDATTPPGVEAGQPVLTASVDPNAVDINAPVPQVRPAFKETQAAGMAVALLPPSRNAASDAIQAALPGDQQEIPSEFADLSDYKIPVPSLLGPRPMNGDAQAEIQTASANIDGMSGDLAVAPLPADRPALAEALVASADGEGEVDGDEAAAALSPSVMAALAQDGSAIRAQLNAGEASAGAEATAAQPVQVAALHVQKPARTVDFGDVFDQPEQSGDGVAAGMPTKGARPKKTDADAATRDPVRGEPKLTQQIISQWALSQARMETMSKAVKAPRFVSHTLRTQPTQVYAAGFTHNAKTVDPARFSGTAVNFMEVRKFDSSD
ncbi:DUF882 domain-containing protein [Rhizobiaceae bacterium n13]|uniref:Murein endopeptidase K n=2 Tax=Ferirhizobium litorale TaxID=2927786 RepID=A0AAE3TZ65_9HYPH|nr:DUF882 domain-containing protein [Fererhizobium litorale]MDI7860529.1 DUF882 domain-containing protein [Fererhizobium litorale]MDI7920664.1 DUF882 domain-containing protein [Fererhizobium litorale]